MFKIIRYLCIVTFNLMNNHAIMTSEWNTQNFIRNKKLKYIQLEQQPNYMQQGQADILIVRFPDPNYGVKTVNFIINSPYLS